MRTTYRIRNSMMVARMYVQRFICASCVPVLLDEYWLIQGAWYQIYDQWTMWPLGVMV
jgi:hypothetical protein